MKYLILILITTLFIQNGITQKNIEKKTSSMIFFQGMMFTNGGQYDEAIEEYEKFS